MSVFFANDKIFAESNRIECARAAEASIDKAASLLSKLDDTDTNCQFKVTEGGVYILGNRGDAMEACERLFGQPKFAADNDNVANRSSFHRDFGYARFGVPHAAGAHFSRAAIAGMNDNAVPRAPQIGMALNAA